MIIVCACEYPSSPLLPLFLSFSLSPPPRPPPPPLHTPLLFLSQLSLTPPSLRHCYHLCRAVRDSTAGLVALIDRGERRRPEFTCEHVQDSMRYSTVCTKLSTAQHSIVQHSTAQLVGVLASSAFHGREESASAQRHTEVLLPAGHWKQLSFPADLS